MHSNSLQDKFMDEMMIKLNVLGASMEKLGCHSKV